MSERLLYVIYFEVAICCCPYCKTRVSFPPGDDACRGPVRHVGRVGGRDGAVLVEGGLQLGHLLQGRGSGEHNFTC